MQIMRKYFLSWMLLYGAILLPTFAKALKLQSTRDHLTADMCSNKTSFSSTVGVFTTYVIVHYQGNNDEGDNATIICGINNSVVQECEDYVISTLQNVKLAINGAVQDDSSVSSTFDPTRETKEFSLTLDYDAHLNANISCIYQLSDQANLTSPSHTISRIDELHDFSITPSKTDITVGSSYSLTCKVDSNRALERLHWTRSIDDGQEKWFYCSPETFCRKETSHDPPEEILIFSTKNETVEDTRNYTYWCTERASSHDNQSLGKAYVSVHPEDRRLFIALVATGTGLVVLVVLVAIGLYIRKRQTTNYKLLGQHNVLAEENI